MKDIAECLEKEKKFLELEKNAAWETLLNMYEFSYPVEELRQQSNYHASLCRHYCNVVMQEIELIKAKYGVSYEEIYKGNYMV